MPTWWLRMLVRHRPKACSGTFLAPLQFTVHEAADPEMTPAPEAHFREQGRIETVHSSNVEDIPVDWTMMVGSHVWSREEIGVGQLCSQPSPPPPADQIRYRDVTRARPHCIRRAAVPMRFPDVDVVASTAGPGPAGPGPQQDCKPIHTRGMLHLASIERQQ